MTLSGTASDSEAKRRAVSPASPPLAADTLAAARMREQFLLSERHTLSQRHALMAREFEHRLINGLQMISSMLSLQSHTASAEAAEQLTIAANRVSALGRVHHRLHVLDHEDKVELKQYLQLLCLDLSEMLFRNQHGPDVVVVGTKVEIPTKFAIPIGFIINELVTNAAKYASGYVTVRISSVSDHHSLSVVDDGPGLPEGFLPEKSKGLGMKIVTSLVTQIGGQLRFEAGDNGRGTLFTVNFQAPKGKANGD
jgi:two-component sensor histidine kinase